MNYLYFAINILLSMPYAAIYICIGLILFGYKDKINAKGIVKFTLVLGLLDAFLTAFVDPSGSIHAVIEPLAVTFLMIVIFNTEILSSIVISIASFLIYFFSSLPFVLVASFIVGFVPGNPNPSQSSQIINVLTMYIIYAIWAGILLFIYKKDFRLINLRRYKAFNRGSNLLKGRHEGIKFLLLCSIPIFICISINYLIYCYSSNGATNYLYFAVNLITIVVSYVIMFFLVKRLLRLNFIESEYKLQQCYMHNIDNLLKDLRAQRHGFNNHVQTLFALLQSKKYDAAKEYISKMHEVVSCKNDLLSVNNPTLCALLNVKTNYAQNNNIKFEVNVDNELSEMNFSAFELVEVLGNVIDNAIEATSASDEIDKYVKITATSDNNKYIFNVENSGKTIPPHILDKIFEEGFTTKEQESNSHGFGLYICKHILEVYSGKIDVISQNNITNFKICLPKVIKNEFRLS